MRLLPVFPLMISKPPCRREPNADILKYQKGKTAEIELAIRESEVGERAASGSLQRAFSQRQCEVPLKMLDDKVFQACIGHGNRIDEMIEWIVNAATEKERFSFPAVCVVLPSAWVDAVDAVEALGKEKGTPYLRWTDAVEGFKRYFQEKRNQDLDIADAESILLEAMKHREAEGGIILSSDVIHLDPRWLIELVRRVIDHNLVDEAKQTQVRGELEAYYETRPQTREGRANLFGAHK